jgi:hypothetical protein
LILADSNEQMKVVESHIGPNKLDIKDLGTWKRSDEVWNKDGFEVSETKGIELLRKMGLESKKEQFRQIVTRSPGKEPYSFGERVRILI